MGVSVPGQALLDLLLVLNSVTTLYPPSWHQAPSSDLWSSPSSQLLYVALK